jgi:hypothetical protein
VSGLGVPLVSVMRGATGGFESLFVLLAVSAALVALAASQLPPERETMAENPAE